MGQNMVGWLRLKVSGNKGTVVTLRHAEVMDKFGEFYTTNLRVAKCQLTFTLAGTGEEIYEPRFTFMGFRYVEVEGLTKKPDENTLVVKVIYENTPFVENIAYSEDFLSKIYTKKAIVEPNLNEAKLIIEPTLASESKTFDSNYGQITSQSNFQGNKFSLKLSIPANSSVQVQLPLKAGKTINNIKESGKPFIVKKKPVKIEGITYLKTEKDKAIFEVLSGNYDFVVE